MAENELVSTGDTLEAEVSGKLRRNYLGGEDDFYVQVDKKLVNVKTTLRAIRDDNKGIDTSMMSHYLEIYQEKILSFLRQGYSVKILDLVTISPVTHGNVKNSTEAKTQSNFSARASVSDLVKKAVQDLMLSDVAYIEEQVSILSVAAMEADDDIIRAGSAVSVTGDNMKVGGEGSGVYLVPLGEDGNPTSARESWVAIPRLLRNVPKELIFNVPASTAEGKYILRIETRMGNRRASKKSIFTGTSSPFEVKRA